MNRTWKLTLSLAILTFVIAGCNEPSKTDSNAASTTSGGSTATGSDPGKTDANASGEPKNNAPAPVAENPKDGDDIAVIETTVGNIAIMFYPDRAPRHVENFMNLAKSGFYNGTRFHRCIPGFMIQGGDPLSKDMKMEAAWGTGGNKGSDGKEINVPAEFNDIHHARGVVSMARSGSPDSASSQFFIMVGDNPGLDGQYSAFGKVVSGMDVADKIVATGPSDPAKNGKVAPGQTVVVKNIKLTKWPVK